jgi:hypothetical protein
MGRVQRIWLKWVRGETRLSGEGGRTVVAVEEAAATLTVLKMEFEAEEMVEVRVVVEEVSSLEFATARRDSTGIAGRAVTIVPGRDRSRDCMLRRMRGGAEMGRAMLAVIVDMAVGEGSGSRWGCEPVASMRTRPVGGAVMLPGEQRTECW